MPRGSYFDVAIGGGAFVCDPALLPTLCLSYSGTPCLPIRLPVLNGGRVARVKGSDFAESCECSEVCLPSEDCISDASFEVVEWLTASLNCSTCFGETPP